MVLGRNTFILAILALALAAIACGGSTRSGNDAEPGPAAGGQISGEQAYKELGCAGCHNGAGGIVAPPLDGLYGQEVQLEGGERAIANEEYLRESILNPTVKIVAGYQPVMPDFSNQISEEEVEALVTYIRSLEN